MSVGISELLSSSAAEPPRSSSQRIKDLKSHFEPAEAPKLRQIISPDFDGGHWRLLFHPQSDDKGYPSVSRSSARADQLELLAERLFVFRMLSTAVFTSKPSIQATGSGRVPFPSLPTFSHRTEAPC